MRVRRRYLVILLFLMVLPAVLVISNTLTQPTSQHAQPASTSPSPLCRSGDPLPQFNPMRVRLITKCEVASGLVKSVTTQDDGAWRIDVGLDTPYVRLLDSGNVNYQDGFLVLELIPQDQATVTIPTVGQHITFVGPLVYDTENQWNAIYPVWSIQGT